MDLHYFVKIYLCWFVFHRYASHQPLQYCDPQQFSCIYNIHHVFLLNWHSFLDKCQFVVKYVKNRFGIFRNSDIKKEILILSVPYKKNKTSPLNIEEIITVVIVITLKRKEIFLKLAKTSERFDHYNLAE